VKSAPAAQDTATDALAARAIERVLEAERDAQAALKACEQACAELLESAREHARNISERARARSVALHGRAAKKLERCASELMEERMKTAAETVRQLADPDRLSAAIEQLTARLTTEAASPDAT
jgi:hypothetical protein